MNVSEIIRIGPCHIRGRLAQNLINKVWFIVIDKKVKQSQLRVSFSTVLQLGRAAVPGARARGLRVPVARQGSVPASHRQAAARWARAPVGAGAEGELTILATPIRIVCVAD